MGRVNVVGATGLIGIGRGAGFVCPKDNVWVVVVKGVALLGNGGDILNGGAGRSTVKPTQRGGYRTIFST